LEEQTWNKNNDDEKIEIKIKIIIDQMETKK